MNQPQCCGSSANPQPSAEYDKPGKERKLSLPQYSVFAQTPLTETFPNRHRHRSKSLTVIPALNSMKIVYSLITQAPFTSSENSYRLYCAQLTVNANCTGSSVGTTLHESFTEQQQDRLVPTSDSQLRAPELGATNGAVEVQNVKTRC